jgi:sterol desaturase/sphingolipid hydroxylase (fatty acid hydroxylase superfamily)
MYAEQTGAGLLYRLDIGPAARFAAAFVALDCWTYWWHRANHAMPLLWRFHRMHHSDPAMDVSTATRFHAGEVALSSGLRLGIVLLAGIPLAALVAYEVALLIFTQFHHANIALPAGLDRVLRGAIVSPNMHKVHHSVERAEMDSNYSSILSVWDRLFGTFHGRDDCRSIVFGVPGMRDEPHQTVAGMLRTPFDSQPRDVPR